MLFVGVTLAQAHTCYTFPVRGRKSNVLTHCLPLGRMGFATQCHFCQKLDGVRRGRHPGAKSLQPDAEQ